MRLFCSGFNLYKQFDKCQNSVIEKFCELKIENIKTFELSHSYNVAVSKDEIIFYGSKSELLSFPDVAQIACNENLVIFLNENGCLYKINLSRNDLLPTPILNIFNAESNCDDKIVRIAAGKKSCVALSQHGKLFELPNKLRFESKNVVDICVGIEHCLLLEENGDVYSFGRGSRGQLGHGDLNDQEEPKWIEGLGGIKIVKIAAGGWHSCAISAEGDLYTWGWDVNGQLGLRKDEDNPTAVIGTPRVVDFESIDVSVVEVACGNRHTIALLDSGKLYGCGWNKYRQLGDVEAGTENIFKMTYLHDFYGTIVSALKCGPWSSMIVIKDNVN